MIRCISQFFTKKISPLFKKRRQAAEMQEKTPPLVNQEISHKKNAIGRKPIRMGLLTIFLFGIIFGKWASTADIESAAVAKGIIVVESKRKSIQHLEGGIIKKIYVEDGDFVKEGQILIELDKTAALSDLQQVKQQLLALTLEKRRLEAELKEEKALSLIASEISPLIESDEKIDDVMRREQKIYLSQINSAQNDIKILEKRVDQMKSEKEGFQLQATATMTQINLLKEEKKTKEELYKKGFASKTSVRRLAQNIAELEGDYGEYRSKVAKFSQNIDETTFEISRKKSTHHDALNDELAEAKVRTENLEEKMLTLQDVVKRHIIKSPESGTVTKVKHHTIGGIVKPGDIIMEVVPQGDELIIEARILPNDIDVVTVGLPARLKLLAFKVKKVPIINGKVIHVSPDRLLDEQTNAPYFLVKIELNQKDLDHIRDINLYPGMQVDVLIVTGARTFFEYLLQPITDSMRKSFRED